MMRCDMLLSANQRQDWACLEIRLIPGTDFRRHISMTLVQETIADVIHPFKFVIHVKKLVDQTRYLYKGTYEVRSFLKRGSTNERE